MAKVSILLCSDKRDALQKSSVGTTHTNDGFQTGEITAMLTSPSTTKRQDTVFPVGEYSPERNKSHDAKYGDGRRKVWLVKGISTPPTRGYKCH